MKPIVYFLLFCASWSVGTNTSPTNSTVAYSSCKNVKSKYSGVYLIRVNNASEPFEVYCEQVDREGGWIVVQRRFDGSVDFNRKWNEYRDGFGNIKKEFWLGLEKMHQITKDRRHEIILEMTNFNKENHTKHAHYYMFEVASERDQYRLTIGNYSGSAGDSLSYNSFMEFSTKDRDNDWDDRHCAQERCGGWWHKRCTKANLNGLYGKKVSEWRSNFWFHFNNKREAFRSTRMMIRELK